MLLRSIFFAVGKKYVVFDNEFKNYPVTSGKVVFLNIKLNAAMCQTSNLFFEFY